MTSTLTPDQRVELDTLLGQLVTASDTAVATTRDPDAPGWWLGDDEASASTTTAAGMVRSSG